MKTLNLVINKKSRVIYHYEEKRVTIWLIFIVILCHKIMQNYRNFYPQKGLMVITSDAVLKENG